MTRRRWMITFASAGACAAAAASVLLLLPVGCQPDSAVPASAGNETRLRVRVFDRDTGAPLPALVNFKTPAGHRITFGNFADLPGWAQGRSAVEIGRAGEGIYAFRHGMALWRGEAVIVAGRTWKHRDVSGTVDIQSGLPLGPYILEISHGVEYDAVEVPVDLSQGKPEASLDVPLTHVVDSAGYLAADLHVHSAPDSSDAYVDASSQLKLAAVNGLNVLVATNHDSPADHAPVVQRLWPNGEFRIATVSGMEKSGPNSHFGLFPIVPDSSKPDKGAPPLRIWPVEAFFEDVRALPARPIVVVNHPRLGWNAYMDEAFCGAWATRDFRTAPPCPQDYDAMELLNGWQSCGTRMRDVTETWLALIPFNIVSAAVGGSDSHFSSAMVPGYPRTWIRVDDDRLAVFQAAGMAQAIRARHTVASNGPLVTLRSGAGTEGDLITNLEPTLTVSIRVQAANWLPVDTVRLLVDGKLVKSWTIPRAEGAIDFRADEILVPGAQDVFVTVETDSQRPLPPHLVGEYNAVIQYGLPKCAPRPGQEPGLPAFAVTSPLFVDRNGDGMFQGGSAPVPRVL